MNVYFYYILVDGGLIYDYFTEKKINAPLNPIDFLPVNLEHGPDGTAAHLGMRDIEYSCLTT